ncbi:type VI secretion system contractile sheath small subunit [Escherichia coli]
MAINNSAQKFIARNRAPRVQIEYDVEIYGSEKKSNCRLSWRCWPIWLGKPREELPPVTDRKFLDIDIDNFNERMKAIAPRVAFAVPNTLTGEGQLMVDITLENMDDFSPAQIARKVDALNQLLEARTQLANLQTYMDGKAGAENLINKLLQDPTLLKALASAPKPVAQQESVLSGETGTAD